MFLPQNKKLSWSGHIKDLVCVTLCEFLDLMNFENYQNLVYKYSKITPKDDDWVIRVNILINSLSGNNPEEISVR